MSVYHTSECGDQLNIYDNNGVIESPGYSQANSSYNVSVQCVWTLNNRQFSNTSIALRFTALDLEPHGECNFDFVEIREGSAVLLFII